MLIIIITNFFLPLWSRFLFEETTRSSKFNSKSEFLLSSSEVSGFEENSARPQRSRAASAPCSPQPIGGKVDGNLLPPSAHLQFPSKLRFHSLSSSSGSSPFQLPGLLVKVSSGSHNNKWLSFQIWILILHSTPTELNRAEAEAEAEPSALWEKSLLSKAKSSWLA